MGCLVMLVASSDPLDFLQGRGVDELWTLSWTMVSMKSSRSKGVSFVASNPHATALVRSFITPFLWTTRHGCVRRNPRCPDWVAASVLCPVGRRTGRLALPSDLRFQGVFRV